MNITDQRSFNLNRNEREGYIAGYSAMIEENMFGRVPHYINFMFHSIPGSRKTKLEVMKRDVTRAHGLLMRSTIHKLDSTNWQASRPIFIGCPDLPVIKRQKQHVRNFMVNDGLQSWTRKFEQPDKWSFCLIAAMTHPTLLVMS